MKAKKKKEEKKEILDLYGGSAGITLADFGPHKRAICLTYLKGLFLVLHVAVAPSFTARTFNWIQVAVIEHFRGTP